MTPRTGFFLCAWLIGAAAFPTACGDSETSTMGSDAPGDAGSRDPGPPPSLPDPAGALDAGVDEGPDRVRQTVQPYVSAAGLGVSDLEAATGFYGDVFGLEVRARFDMPDAWREVVLTDLRGNGISMMDFAQDARTKDNPVKLVFAVPDATKTYARILALGGRGYSAPRRVEGTLAAIAYDPDGYLLQLVEIPSARGAVLITVGIGVSDLDVSAAYYTRVLGMRSRFDIEVPGLTQERELVSPLMRGPSIVLMHYENPNKSYRDVPAKIVLRVPDARAYARTIEEDDASRLVREPAPYGDTGLTVGVARDLEGYYVEFVEGTARIDGGVAEAGVAPAPSLRSGMDAGL